MRKLVLVLVTMLLAGIGALTLGMGPASAATRSCPVNQQMHGPGGAVICPGGSGVADSATPFHHVTAEQKAWTSWKKAHDTFAGWRSHHRRYVKHHSHRSEVRAFNRYKHLHTHAWWVRHVWHKHHR